MKEYKGYNYNKEKDGTYTVYTKEGRAWIVGFKTEEDAKKQIDNIVESEENAGKEQATLESLQEQVTDLQLALAELVEGGNV